MKISILINKWNLYYDINIYNIDEYDFLKEFIVNFVNKSPRILKKYTNDIRNFCRKIYNNDNYYKHLLTNLSEIQDDYSLLHYFILLL